MTIHKGVTFTVVFLWIVAGSVFSPAFGQQPYEGDPDSSDSAGQVQPPPLPPSSRLSGTKAPSSVVNGVTYIDVLLSAGYDDFGWDRGNEPAITANPLNPNQIVLTSFAGSSWAFGGNASLFYSGDAGATWVQAYVVPPPPGVTNDVNCPCDQTVDWGRNGVLYGTFLHNWATATQAVYSAESTNPLDPSSWTYRTPAGVAQPTNLPGYPAPDQPWLWSGPLPGDNSQTNVCVGYDNFSTIGSGVEVRTADSPGATPLDFTRDASVNSDLQVPTGNINPGTRIAVGPDGKIYTVFQRFVSAPTDGQVKQLTYLISVSTDGGLTWSVTNSDHPSGAKIVAANVLSFQGNGSKIGDVNALLGGVDALAVDRAGTVWVVYGARPTLTGTDQLYLVPVTYSNGSLTVGARRTLTSSALNNYLPSVAVLPNNEVGVLFLTMTPSPYAFQWTFVQWTNGAILAKSTSFPSFTSPIAPDIGDTRQRIFGDYIQVRAVGCNFYGVFPAKGAGVNSVTSIDPYFMSAPSFNACTLPTLTAISPTVTCAGGPGFNLLLQGTGYVKGATGRVQGVLRNTAFLSTTQVSTAVLAGDISSPGIKNVDLLGAMPAGGLTGSLPLTVETPAASPGATLRASPSGGNVALSWGAAAGATKYAVRRCNATAGPCVPASIATPVTNSYNDPVLLDGNSYWYLIDAVNSCGATP